MKKFSCQINGAEHVLQCNFAKSEFQFNGEAFPASVAQIAPGWYSIVMDGVSFDIRVSAADEFTQSRPSYRVLISGEEIVVEVSDPRKWVRGGAAAPGPEAAGCQRITAPMPGKVVRVLVAEGQAVEAGQGLIVVEAMKMQNEIKSAKAGVVGKIAASAGQTVAAGQALLVIE